MTNRSARRKNQPCYIHGCGFHSALGLESTVIHERLKSGASPDMVSTTEYLVNNRPTVVGRVSAELPPLPMAYSRHDSRNNRLAFSALDRIRSTISVAVEKFGADRVAVVVGTSTSGISDGEDALAFHAQNGMFPADFHYRKQEIGNLGEFVADVCRARGPAYTISTACSSSGRAFLAAKRLLLADMADAVVVGGADTLCRLTLNGFLSLESLSATRCNPFSVNRNGINIGEAAAFMLLTLAPDPRANDQVALLGAGESSDAHHISAPHPEGEGAERAMRSALDDANLSPEDVGYINAHGTATPLNDIMEAKAVSRVFGGEVPVSSTKPLTGHTLGAAGAAEAAICWHVLRHDLDLPFQVNDGQADPAMPPLALAAANTRLTKPAILSNSFAFGGSNISLIFGRCHE